jgi:hypothetical protein
VIRFQRLPWWRVSAERGFRVGPWGAYFIHRGIAYVITWRRAR